MAKNLKAMTDAEYGKYIREQTKVYNERAKVTSCRKQVRMYVKFQKFDVKLDDDNV